LTASLKARFKKLYTATAIAAAATATATAAAAAAAWQFTGFM
jgi:hypothetical protein